MNTDFLLDQANLAWLDLDDVENIPVGDIFAKVHHTDEIISAYEFLKIITKPNYLHAICKEILDIQLLPIQNVMLQELWVRKFPMLIASRGFGKSFSLAIICILKSLLVPGTKVVITGAGFRQAKLVYDYIENIWNNAPILRNICNAESGSYKDSDRWHFKINDSSIIAIPMGTGEKIRGIRANVIVAEEFNCLSKDTLIETINGLYRLRDLEGNLLPVLTGDGNCPIETPFEFVKTPPIDVYEITTQYGYQFKCSKKHKVFTQNGEKLAYKLKKGELLNAINNYQFPVNKIKIDGVEIDENLAWIMGALISEGNVSNKGNADIHSADKLFLETFAEKINKVKEFDININEYYKKSYIDARGWNCKESWDYRVYNVKFKEFLNKCGISNSYAIQKKIPDVILRSPRSVVIAFLSALFWGEGSCFLWSDNKKNHKRLGVAYYSVSETLTREIQTILYKLNILCYINCRYNDISNNKQWFLRLNGKYAYNFAEILNIPKWEQTLKSAYNPNKMKYLIYTANYWRYIRNNKYIFKSKDKQKVIDRINEDMILEETHRWLPVRSVRLLPEKEVLYDINLNYTHSFYGNIFKQHNSLEPSVYEKVVQGFASVRPKPIDNVMLAARRDFLVKHGMWSEEQQQMFDANLGNQSIISGTAGYDFQHFAQYWKRYHSIITGNRLKMVELLGDMAGDLDASDFSIIRIPYELIPKGFMDDKQITRAKATVHSGVYMSEYGAVFVKDSEGFFKRTLIESCVTNPSNNICDTKGNQIVFDATLKGDQKLKYIIGIDPAASRDNLAIVVLELHDDHWRIVYCWTTNEKEHKRHLKEGTTTQENYYSFCARKVRDLMLVFPTVRIGIDGQGGGKAVMEALHDKSVMNPGEEQLWPIIDPDKEADTDDRKGAHIIEKIEFADSKWTSEANHGMKKDMEMKYLLFPRYDGLSLALAAEKDLRNMFEEVSFESIEGIIAEIEELKNELTTIVMTPTTQNERDRWDTPEIKEGTGKKGRLKKDRYSALVIANMIARTMSRSEPAMSYAFIGGTTKDLAGSKGHKLINPYEGSTWYNVDPNIFGAVSTNKRK